MLTLEDVLRVINTCGVGISGEKFVYSVDSYIGVRFEIFGSERTGEFFWIGGSPSNLIVDSDIGEKVPFEVVNVFELDRLIREQLGVEDCE